LNFNSLGLFEEKRVRPNGKVNGSNGYSPAPAVADEMIRSTDRAVRFREYQREANRRFRGGKGRPIPRGLDASEAVSWLDAEREIARAEDIQDGELAWQIVDAACASQERLEIVAKIRSLTATAHEIAERAKDWAFLPDMRKARVREQLRAMDRHVAAGASLLSNLDADTRQELERKIQDARGALAHAFQALR
jgi:hypothetical protein